MPATLRAPPTCSTGSGEPLLLPGRLIDPLPVRAVYFSRRGTRSEILYSAGYTLRARRNLNHKPPPTRLLFSGGDIVNSYSADVASNAEIMEVGAIRKKEGEKKRFGDLSLFLSSEIIYMDQT